MRTRIFFLFILSFCFLNHGFSQEHPSIIPLPENVQWETGTYSLPEEVSICYNEKAENSIHWIKTLLERTSTSAKFQQDKNCQNWQLKIDASFQKDLGDEGYQLKIDSKGIQLQSATEAGMFYAIQTLRQMFPAEMETGKISEAIKLNYVDITDKPAFAWRGSMLDIARSFLNTDYIKKHIDLMALYKLNRLHLHLSDDQGWRIEIKKYPELTEIGGKSAVKNGRAGFLTQQDYADLQAYAKARNIIIIPEIDMPGHMYAALASLPQLNCKDTANIDPKLAVPPKLYDGYQVGWSRLCLEESKTYDFVDDIVGELASITEGDWIHIGGDEIKDTLYEEFIHKADSIVLKHGKTAIGWEESAKSNLSKSFLVQRWNGGTEIPDDQKIIDSFCKYFYLDHGNIPDQENTYKWCINGLTLEQVYSYETSDPRVIGVEAAIWSELVISNDRADERLWPRLAAVAEIGWTAQKKRNFQNFVERLAGQTKRLSDLGINFYKSKEVDWEELPETGVFSEKLSTN